MFLKILKNNLSNKIIYSQNKNNIINITTKFNSNINNNIIINNKKSLIKNNKKLFSSEFTSKQIDEKDDLFFKTIKDWWNPQGSMRTLHHYNDLRVEYIIDILKNTQKIKENKLNKILPLENINFLDIGCGAGILTEVKYKCFNII
jgi:hypothetical protein